MLKFMPAHSADFRTRFSAVWMILFTLTVTGIGCWGGSQPSAPENSGSTPQASPAAAVNKNREIVADWPKPAIALVLTGEQHGYLEPCGCSDTQSGGISRRADLFRQLREEKEWPVVGVDLGDTQKRSRRQDAIKFGILHTALTDMGYEALAFGPSDLKLQADFLFSTVPNSTDPETPLPFVAANVVFYDTPDIGTPAHFTVIEKNGVKIGVTAILGTRYAEQIFPQGNNSANALVKVEDPVASLKPALASLKEQKCDLLLLLSQAPRPETEAILKEIPDFDLCLTGGGPEDPSGLTTKIGQTVVMEAGRKGKYAGVLGYFPEDAEQKFRFELVDLDQKRFQRTPEMEALMAYYQDLLREERLVETESAVPHSSGHQFIGSEKCGTCHTKAFAHWKTTKHSHATETLVHGDKTSPHYDEATGVSRIHDPECLACHAVGWAPQEVFRYESGFISLEKTPHLTGQGCENCHGPGSHHAELESQFQLDKQNTPELTAARQAMKLDLVTVEKQVCRKCHDYENSPDFDFVKYWEKVVHRGKN